MPALRFRPVLALLLAVIAVLAAAALFVAQRQSAPTLTLEELRSRYGSAQSRYVRVGGVEVHYYDEGQGPAILMLHGSFGNLHTFDDVAAALRSHYRIIRFDQPPAGLTGPVPADFAMNSEQFIDEFLRAVSAPRVAILATSSGGILAYRYAGTHPDNVSALILSNVPPMAPVDNAGALARASLWDRASLTVCGRYAKPWSRACTKDFLHSTFHRQEILTDALVDQYYDMNRRAGGMKPNSMSGLERQDARAVSYLSRVTAPTLLLWGSLDHVLQPPTAQLLAKRLSATQAQLQMLPDVAHYPPLEAPQETIAAVEAFLQKLGADKSGAGPASPAPAGAAPISAAPVSPGA